MRKTFLIVRHQIRLASSFAILLALAVPDASAAQRQALLGMYTFGWYRTAALKCMTIDSKLLHELSLHYKCTLRETRNTASREAAFSCMKIDETNSYLVFKTREKCEIERQTQNANGP